MAAKLDVAGRLAEARQAVDNTQSYVWAAHLLDYQNADLTLHPAQVRDWFSSEDGMDLHVLDVDASAMQAVAAVADDAVARQRDQAAALAAAWQGAGAASAEEFLRRHCDAAEKVATSARQAAEALADLREVLWQIVDTKVAAVSAIDDRRRAERPAWVAAAQTVTTGVGDRAAASELVAKQVKPFVDNDIRNDWLTAVRAAIASIGSSYDAATAGVTVTAPMQFDVPGDLGPDPAPPSPHDDTPPPRDAGSPTTATAAPSPSALPSTPAPSYPPPSYSSPPTMPAPAMAAMPAGVPAASPAPTPSALPASSPSGFDGLAQPVADALRGLLPSSGDDALPDKSALDPPTVGDPPSDPPAEDETADTTDDEKDCDTIDHGPEDQSPPTVVDDAGPAPTPPPPAEPPPPPPAPEAPEAPPPDPPAEGTSTPCEIAASELPQAGQ